MVVFSRLMRRLFACVVGFSIISVFHPILAQKANYPANYFALPVYPGQPNSLSGALGDLRTNHFHAGIDVRTRQKEGLPITAAAEGFVSKIAVQRSGYGKVLYIRHPNGMTTVYAHLMRFSDQIDQYVRAEQYKQQSFEINLTPEEGRFPVSKGQLVAISGNTGGSEGPHLHFEIRDSRDNCLNPLFFNFPEIKDTTPPRFVSIALSPLDMDSRVNGRIDRQAFRPDSKPKPGTGEEGRWVSIKDTIRAAGVLGLELQAFDRMDGTGFNYGLNCIEVRIDGKEVFAFNMEKFPIDVARDYNYLINYKARVADWERYYKCYNPEGNKLDIYKTDAGRGKIRLNDTLSHTVEIKIFDSFENWSGLRFVLSGEKNGLRAAASQKGNTELVTTDVSGHILKLTAAGNAGVLYESGREIPLEAAYEDGGRSVFLASLKQHLPDSVRIGASVKKLNFVGRIAPGAARRYEGKDAVIDFGDRSLFDTLYLNVYRVGNTLQINDYTEPLRGPITVSYRPEVEENVKGKTHIYRLVNGRDQFIGGEWSEQGIRFDTRELGTFYPMADAEPPQVRLLQSTPKMISARIADNLSGIASFKAKVNGTWVLMNYEYKRNLIWSEKIEDAVPFEGELELEVTDRAGNITIVKAPIAEPPPRKTRSKSRR